MSTRHVSALNVLVLTLWRNLMMVSNFACIVTRGVDCTTLMLKCWFKLENIIVTCFFCKIGRKLNIGLTGWSILWCGIYWVATLFCQYMNVVFFLCSPLCICSHPDIHYQRLSNSKVVCPFSKWPIQYFASVRPSVTNKWCFGHEHDPQSKKFD